MKYFRLENQHLRVSNLKYFILWRRRLWESSLSRQSKSLKLTVKHHEQALNQNMASIKQRLDIASCPDSCTVCKLCDRWLMIIFFSALWDKSPVMKLHTIVILVTVWLGIFTLHTVECNYSLRVGKELLYTALLKSLGRIHSQDRADSWDQTCKKSRSELQGKGLEQNGIYRRYQSNIAGYGTPCGVILACCLSLLGLLPRPACFSRTHCWLPNVYLLAA